MIIIIIIIISIIRPIISISKCFTDILKIYTLNLGMSDIIL